MRERCSQGLAPAEEEIASKLKAHQDFVSLTSQTEYMTTKLHFLDALSEGVLPAELLTLEALEQSSKIGKAEAALASLVAQRQVLIPEGSTPSLQVTNTAVTACHTAVTAWRYRRPLSPPTLHPIRTR